MKRRFLKRKIRKVFPKWRGEEKGRNDGPAFFRELTLQT